MSKQVVIVTPALADANNGNWRTAQRWARFLSGRFRVRLASAWPDANAAADDVLIALHARRSAGSVGAWHAERGSAGLGLVLTGTDLYRDIGSDADAQRSLGLAQEIVVLQELGTDSLPPEYRAKTRVIFQSASPRRPLVKTERRLRAVMVGHLRAEKSPETLFATARELSGRTDIVIDHVGAALDPALGELARETAAACPNYRWHGALSHRDARSRIQRAHVLVHTSRIEGGAHVLIEAMTCGTPVLASRIDGNVGLLGAGYPGYFEWGDAARLAGLLAQCRAGQSMRQGLLQELGVRVRERAVLFAPAAERTAVLALAHDLGRDARTRRENSRGEAGSDPGRSDAIGAGR